MSGGSQSIPGSKTRKPPHPIIFTTAAPVAPTREGNPMTQPDPPEHLSADAAAWWRDVVRDYSLETHHVRLLQAACESWDRMAQARRELDGHGALTFTDERGVIRTHPAIAVERDSTIRFARLVRELDLDAGASAVAAPRPPALVSNRRGG